MLAETFHSTSATVLALPIVPRHSHCHFDDRSHQESLRPAEWTANQTRGSSVTQMQASIKAASLPHRIDHTSLIELALRRICAQSSCLAHIPEEAHAAPATHNDTHGPADRKRHEGSKDIACQQDCRDDALLFLIHAGHVCDGCKRDAVQGNGRMMVSRTKCVQSSRRSNSRWRTNVGDGKDKVEHGILLDVCGEAVAQAIDKTDGDERDEHEAPQEKVE